MPASAQPEATAAVDPAAAAAIASSAAITLVIAIVFALPFAPMTFLLSRPLHEVRPLCALGGKASVTEVTTAM
jgi:hypothetical protein